MLLNMLLKKENDGEAAVMAKESDEGHTNAELEQEEDKSIEKVEETQASNKVLAGKNEEEGMVKSEEPDQESDSKQETATDMSEKKSVAARSSAKEYSHGDPNNLAEKVEEVENGEVAAKADEPDEGNANTDLEQKENQSVEQVEESQVSDKVIEDKEQPDSDDKKENITEEPDQESDSKEETAAEKSEEKPAEAESSAKEDLIDEKNELESAKGVEVEDSKGQPILAEDAEHCQKMASEGAEDIKPDPKLAETTTKENEKVVNNDQLKSATNSEAEKFKETNKNGVPDALADTSKQVDDDEKSKSAE